MSKEQRQSKKEQFAAKQAKGGLGKVISLVGAILVAAVVGWLVLGQGASNGNAAVKSVNGLVNIDVSKIDDGKAHFFKFASNQGEIKFFVVKSVDGVLRAAFDACDVCYREKKGYRQEGDYMVCNNCGQKFRTDLVNEVKGGCNPAPLNRQVKGNQLVITAADLLKGAWYFGG